MKTWVVGDVHGAAKALKQVLERAPISKGDKIIFLGDMCDGWSETFEVIEICLELSKEYECIFIRGNHDDEFVNWINTGVHRWFWEQGASATAISYIRHADRTCTMAENYTGFVTNLTTFDLPISHVDFFRGQHFYYIDDNKNCFVHGGFNRHMEFKGQSSRVYFWDRDLWNAALGYESMIDDDGLYGKLKNRFKMKDDFENVFIGHTATVNWGLDTPMKAANIWNLDTGAGFKGKLTIMNVDTKEYFQSDNVQDLYPDEKGR